nr:hypothetical protein [Acidimicrobiia bacterium]
LADLDVDAARSELAELVREADGPGAAPNTNRTIEALRAQLSSASRLDAVARDARDRLRLLDARLDEAVARAVELALQAGDEADVSGLGSDVDSVVGEMESLRVALEQTGPGHTAVASS